MGMVRAHWGNEVARKGATREVPREKERERARRISMANATTAESGGGQRKGMVWGKTIHAAHISGGRELPRG